jgi:hypothetical protein
VAGKIANLVERVGRQCDALGAADIDHVLPGRHENRQQIGIVAHSEGVRQLGGAVFVAQFSDRSRNPPVQFLVGFILPCLRCFQSLEVRSRRVTREQEVFTQANVVRSHFVPRKTRYKFSGAGNDANLVRR